MGRKVTIELTHEQEAFFERVKERGAKPTEVPAMLPLTLFDTVLEVIQREVPVMDSEELLRTWREGLETARKELYALSQLPRPTWNAAYTGTAVREALQQVELTIDMLEDV